MNLDIDPGKYCFNEQQEFDVALITIDQGIRDLCEENACGQYGTNYMCPPAIKGIEEWKKDIYSYRKGLMVTKAYPTNGPFDIKTWLEAMADFQKRMIRLKRDILKKDSEQRLLLLGAGACRLCKVCACIKHKACLFPGDAFPSLEACGIDVMALSKRVGVKYNNGKNTVTYIGAVLY
ncbi:MAG: DUF2284 domain-containing protein [Deltaproteobacteria bacterium]|nr:DUF2284 domain-containing protein [Deltaproteobacteria bacterium]